MAPLHHSRERHVESLGPAPADTCGASRQERLFAAAALDVALENPRAACPGAHPSRRRPVYQRRGGEDHDLRAILWDKPVCGGCALRARCLPAGQDQRTLRLSRYYDLLWAGRRAHKSEAFRERYRRRAGIEATFWHVVNVPGARRTPYRGPDTTLGYFAALCVGVKLRRVAAWEGGEVPKRQRRSRLARLLAQRNVEGALCAA